MWSALTGMVMQSLTIPRGVCVLAGGKFTGEYDATKPVTIEVQAKLGDPDWGVIQSPFMRDNASTLAYSHSLTVEDGRMRYKESTLLDIYGRKFDHTDSNVVVRE
jgi:hypothetical protein